MKKMKRLMVSGAIAVSLVMALGGCGPRGEQVMIQNAKSVPFSKGYGDGCETGRKMAGVRNAQIQKDLHLYDTNAQYRTAWNAGYRECKAREERVSKLSKTLKNVQKTDD
jgi:hypothetical protein